MSDESDKAPEPPLKTASTCSDAVEPVVNSLAGSISVYGILRTFCQSLLFGIPFVLFTVAVLYGIEILESWRLGGWKYIFRDVDHYWIYLRGGFPCIGVFAIASASYFTSKLVPCRIVLALLSVGVVTLLIVMIASVTGLLPRMYKGVDIHWHRPAFILWLTIPPWLVAVAIVLSKRNIHQRNHDVERSST